MLGVDDVAAAMIGTGVVGGVTNLIGQANAAAASREQIAYQKWAQGETWKREDTAVQRRVQDLRNAGLSPTLAAGSAASTSAPIQVGMEQTVDPGAALQATVAAMQPIMMRAQLAQTMAGIRATEAQTQKTQYDTATQEFNNKIKALMFPDEQQKLLSEVDKINIDAAHSSALGGLAYRALMRDKKSNLRPGSLTGDMYDVSQTIGDILERTGSGIADMLIPHQKIMREQLKRKGGKE